MTFLNQIWKCEICGNIIEILHEGADSLVCCGKPMILQEEKTIEEEGKEKHVPIIENNLVKVGSVEHPMTEEHFIEWIEGEHSGSQSTSRIFLKPGNRPLMETTTKVKSARAYCNIHGLWKSE
jgi:superoxide reductase